jgi:uncharacterized protein
MDHLKAGYGLDPEGFILSNAAIGKINEAYWPCIRETTDLLRDLFPDLLHSVYVYGSVARGDAVVPTSDLDLIALFRRKLGPGQSARLKQLSDDQSARYRSLVREVGIAIADYDTALDPSNYYENAFLREMSVCVYGEDLGERFGPYKLKPEIAIQFNGDICESLRRTLKKLEAASDGEAVQIVQGFARKLIRTFYSMAMARSRIWTTRLSEQAEVAARHFPDRAAVVRTLLDWSEYGPPADRSAVTELLRQEGGWACSNFGKEARIT